MLPRSEGDDRSESSLANIGKVENCSGCVLGKCVRVVRVLIICFISNLQLLFRFLSFRRLPHSTHICPHQFFLHFSHPFLHLPVPTPSRFHSPPSYPASPRGCTARGLPQLVELGGSSGLPAPLSSASQPVGSLDTDASDADSYRSDGARRLSVGSSVCVVRSLARLFV